jgi:hypothetical protein
VRGARSGVIIVVTPTDIGCGLYGCADWDDRIIQVRGGQSPAEERDTVLHELMHALLGPQESNRKKTVHDFIYDTAPRLQKVFATNPELMRYLGARDCRGK